MKILTIGNYYTHRIIQHFQNDSITVIHHNDISQLNNNQTQYDIIFICIDYKYSEQTQNIEDIQNTISYLRNLYINPIIVNTSTLLPGTHLQLQLHYLPFFLPQSFTQEQVQSLSHWHIGLLPNSPDHIKDTITTLFTTLKEYNSIKDNLLHFSNIDTIEFSKFASNAFSATQIAFFNELSIMCQDKQLDYSQCIELFNTIPHFQQTFHNVPGPDQSNGFGGPFLMKDLLTFTQSYSQPTLLTNVIHRNIKHHRKNNNDWIKYIKNDSLHKNMTLSQLNQYCIQHQIDIDDCIERNDIIEKILTHQFITSQQQQQPQQTSCGANTHNLGSSSQPQQEEGGGGGHGGGGILTQPQQQQQKTPIYQQQPVTNNPPQQFVPRQSGIPVQINQPTSAPFNMNVRSNNGGMFMNMRPSANPNVNRGGGINFNGGMQRRVR